MGGFLNINMQKDLKSRLCFIETNQLERVDAPIRKATQLDDGKIFDFIEDEQLRALRPQLRIDEWDKEVFLSRPVLVGDNQFVTDPAIQEQIENFADSIQFIINPHTANDESEIGLAAINAFKSALAIRKRADRSGANFALTLPGQVHFNKGENALVRFNYGDFFLDVNIWRPPCPSSLLEIDKYIIDDGRRESLYKYYPFGIYTKPLGLTDKHNGNLFNFEVVEKEFTTVVSRLRQLRDPRHVYRSE